MGAVPDPPGRRVEGIQPLVAAGRPEHQQRGGERTEPGGSERREHAEGYGGGRRHGVARRPGQRKAERPGGHRRVPWAVGDDHGPSGLKRLSQRLQARLADAVHLTQLA